MLESFDVICDVGRIRLAVCYSAVCLPSTNIQEYQNHITDILQPVNSLWYFIVFVNSILGSRSEDTIYTNAWSILNHKIEKIPCQQLPSVKFMFIRPWNLLYIFSSLQIFSTLKSIRWLLSRQAISTKKKKKALTSSLKLNAENTPQNTHIWRKYHY